MTTSLEAELSPELPKFGVEMLIFFDKDINETFYRFNMHREARVRATIDGLADRQKDVHRFLNDGAVEESDAMEYLKWVAILWRLCEEAAKRNQVHLPVLSSEILGRSLQEFRTDPRSVEVIVDKESSRGPANERFYTHYRSSLNELWQSNPQRASRMSEPVGAILLSLYKAESAGE